MSNILLSEQAYNRVFGEIQITGFLTQLKKQTKILLDFSKYSLEAPGKIEPPT